MTLPTDNITISKPGKKKPSTDNPRLLKEKKAKSNTLQTAKSAPKSKAPKVKRCTKIIFQLHFHTTYGQELFITGNHSLLGNNDPGKAVPMQYFNEEYWSAVIEPGEESIPAAGIVYNYILKNTDGSLSYDW